MKHHKINTLENSEVGKSNLLPATKRNLHRFVRVLFFALNPEVGSSPPQADPLLKNHPDSGRFFYFIQVNYPLNSFCTDLR